MPAIQPARLRHQAVELSSLYRQPEVFIKRLHDILGSYTDRTHRPGQSGEPRPLMMAYNVPPPVMRQIMSELKPLVPANLDDTLALCDMLWKQPYWELRSLAANLLGQYQAEDYSPVFSRINDWLNNDPGDQVASLILENATCLLRKEASSMLFEWTKDLIASEQVHSARIALRLLAVLAKDGKIEDFPTIFKQTNPLLRTLPQSLRQDLLNLLQELARRSPSETAYILRKNLETEDSSNAAWVIRQVLEAFPVSYQEIMRSAIRQRGLS